MASVDSKKKGPRKSAEELVAGFNVLRGEQRQIASKIYELEGDLSEHRIVIESLKTVDEGRKCYRMIGGVLIERTVKDVLPDLESNMEQIKRAVELLNTKLIEKGKEIVEYKEKNNIQFQVPERIVEEDEPEETKPAKPGVLVGEKRWLTQGVILT